MRPDTLDDQDNQINQGYERGFDSGEKAYVSAGLNQAETHASDLDITTNNPDIASSAESINRSEENSSGKWKTSVSPSDNTSSYADSRSDGGLSKNRVKAFFNKKTGAGAVVGLLIGGAGFIGFSSVVLGPIALFENLITRFDDTSINMSKRARVINNLRSLPESEKRQAVAGCRTMSLRCKFATISGKQKARFGRTIPTEYEFRGRTYSASEWRSAISQPNSAEARAQYRSNHMRYMAFSDSRAGKFIYKRFNMTKAAPGLKGNMQDRINQMLTRSGSTSLKGVRVTLADDPENPDKPFRVEDNNGRQVLDSDGKPIELSDGEARKMRKTIEFDTKSPPTRAMRGSVGALSVIGYVDLACTIKNMIGAAAVAAKVVARAESIKLYLSVGAYAHKIKAGDATPEDIETLGTLLNRKDNRKLLLDKQKTAEYIQQNPNIEPEDIPDIYSDDINPNYNKSVMDSAPVLSVMAGGYNTMSDSEMLFNPGGGHNRWLNGIENTAQILDTIINVGSNGKVCSAVQNPLVRLAGIGAAVGLAIVSGGSSAAAQGAIMAGLMAVMIGVSYGIQSMLDNSLIAYINENEEDTGAMASGLTYGAAATGEVNAMIGAAGFPVTNTDQASQLESDRKKHLAMQAQIEREESGFFDIYNQHSVMGSISRVALSQFSYSSRFSEVITRLPLVSVSSISNTLANSAAASNGSSAVYDKCDDEEYLRLGISPDMFCNIRYSLPADYANTPTEDVFDYMIDRGYVPADTADGLPEGYTPPDPNESQNAITSFVRDATVGNFFSRRDLRNDYAKFLDYCVYRTQPFGDTYEETELWGGADRAWITGEKCLNKEGSKDLAMMMLFTLDVRVQQALDEEEMVSDTESTLQGGESITIVTGSDRELAQAIKDNPNIEISNRYQYQIDNYANGQTSCELNSDLLRLIATLGETRKIFITSINRKCTGSTAGAGRASLHWRGRAVDFGSVDGVSSTGATTNDIKVYNDALRILPDKRLALGQSNCRRVGAVNIPPGNTSYEHSDTCHHIHIGVTD